MDLMNRDEGEFIIKVIELVNQGFSNIMSWTGVDQATKQTVAYNYAEAIKAIMGEYRLPKPPLINNPLLSSVPPFPDRSFIDPTGMVK